MAENKNILVDKSGLSRFLDNIKEMFSPINRSISDLETNKVNLPMDENGNVLNGEIGQSLISNGDGSVSWKAIVTEENASFEGSMSLGREEGSVVGNNSVAMGVGTIADSESAFAMGDNAQAIAPGTHAEGKSTVAGCKGYYYRYIDLDRKKIYLADEQPTIDNPPTIVTEEMQPVSSFLPNWPVGTGLAVYNQATYWGEIFVESITEGVITYSGDFSLTEILQPEKLNYDTFAVYAPEYPHEGEWGVTYGGHAEGYLTVASGNYSHAEGGATYAIGNYAHAEGRYTTASGGTSHAEGNNNVASGQNSHAEGRKTVASGAAAHAEGDTAKAFGDYSHAEGYQTEASGRNAHAEGYLVVASGNHAHAEGRENTASGDFSHVEGRFNETIGNYSHAEGRNTLSKGMYTHTEGYGTIANSQGSHAQGKFNLEDTASKYAHIVGNGTSDSTRSNAHTLDWKGNAWFAGTVDATNIGAVKSLKTTAKDSLVNAVNENVGRLSAVEEQTKGISANKEDIDALTKIVTYCKPFNISFIDAKNYYVDDSGTRFYMTLDTYGDNWRVSEKSEAVACKDADTVGYMRLFLDSAVKQFRLMSAKKDYVFNFTAASEGKYKLTANIFSIGGGGSADVYINDTLVGTVSCAGEGAITPATFEIGEALLKGGELANELRFYTKTGITYLTGVSFEDINDFSEGNHEYRLTNLETLLNGVDSALDRVIEIQNNLIGGNV